MGRFEEPAKGRLRADLGLIHLIPLFFLICFLWSLNICSISYFVRLSLYDFCFYDYECLGPKLITKHAQLGLSDKVCAIQRLVIYNVMWLGSLKWISYFIVSFINVYFLNLLLLAISSLYYLNYHIFTTLVCRSRSFFYLCLFHNIFFHLFLQLNICI